VHSLTALSLVDVNKKKKKKKNNNNGNIQVQ
jgi:hypothetical protein